MKALLTGASSFTGYWFAKALCERGVEVVAPLRGSVDGYAGTRAQRVRKLAEVAEIVPNVSFGSPEFLSLIDRSSCDVLCHHAAHVADYRSPDFDVNRALAENTKGFKALSERMAGRAVVLTGSVFEPNEGAGNLPLRAFSPYGLSKALTAEVVRYWCEVARISLGKFVIANPFGPLEEPRFCAYLVKTWAAGAVPEVRTPSYVRDNIHVSLLAKAYAGFVTQTVDGKRSGRLAPTGYVENQGAFAERFAREMGRRFPMACPVRTLEQTDFSEPMVRINTDPVDVGALHWSEAGAWDEIADYYAAAFAPR